MLDLVVAMDAKQQDLSRLKKESGLIGVQCAFDDGSTRIQRRFGARLAWSDAAHRQHPARRLKPLALPTSLDHARCAMASTLPTVVNNKAKMAFKYQAYK